MARHIGATTLEKYHRKLAQELFLAERNHNDVLLSQHFTGRLLEIISQAIKREREGETK